MRYYTIDHMDRPESWTVTGFDTLGKALRHYLGLPLDGRRALNMTNGTQSLLLVCSVPILGMEHCEDVLFTPPTMLPEWAAKESGALFRCVDVLHLRYLVDGGTVIPIPHRWMLPKKLEHCTIVLNTRSLEKAFLWADVAGVGRVPPQRLPGQYPARPLVLAYWVDVVTDDGVHLQMELCPWTYRLLLRRSLDRIAEKVQRDQEVNIK